MSTSPFYAFRNATFTFEVDSNLEYVDASGNVQPSKRKVTVEAFVKPTRFNSSKTSIADRYPGVDVNSEILEGYIVNPTTFPVGVSVGDRTVQASYRGQQGVFIRQTALQSAVKADEITGQYIKGIFQLK